MKSRVYLLFDLTVLFVTPERRIPLIRLIFRASITAKSGGELKPGFSPARGILCAQDVVKVAHPMVSGGFNLDYGTGGRPAGWDRFGRPINQKWASDSGALKVQHLHAYDRTGNKRGCTTVIEQGKEKRTEAIPLKVWRVPIGAKERETAEDLEVAVQKLPCRVLSWEEKSCYNGIGRVEFKR